MTFGLCQVNVGVGGTVLQSEVAVPPLGAKTTTAAVADAPTWRPPLPEAVDHRGEEGELLRDVDLDPIAGTGAAPVAAEHRMVAPALSVHVEVAVMALSPR